MEQDMITYLSKLGKPSFSESEKAALAEDMTSIISVMDSIKDINVTYDPLADNKEVYLKDLRVDAAEPSMATAKILENAVHSGNCFVVPKVVE